jgi:septal ring factor EnvC (AmiA/AmiB activator)
LLVPTITMRGFMFVFAVVGAVPSVAMAEQNAEVCHAQLSELDEARVTLEELEASVASMKAERSELNVRDAELAAEIPQASGGKRKALVAEREAVQADLTSIAELLPAIEAQAQALRSDVDAAERAYIGCIESTIR